MKFTRMLAVGAAAAFVGVSTLAVGGTASAADFYVDDSQLSAVESGPYPAGWFQGGVAPGGSFESTSAGLAINGQIQILNGIASPVPTTDLVALAHSSGLTLASGNATIQIPIFTNNGAGYTTLYADPAGIANNLWYTNRAFGTFAAGATATIEDLAAQMTNPTILAFGFHVVAGFSAEVVSLTWDGDTYWFLPAAPTATASPASATLNAFVKDGITLTFTGYIPGEEVILGGNSPDSAGMIGTVTADANGTVVYEYTGTASSALGTYDVTATGLTSGVQSFVEFAVTANPAQLAATGADFTPAIVSGSLLLLLGAGFVVAGRRRAAAHRS